MQQKIELYVGTYTKESPAEGIYYAELDLATGKFDNLTLVAKSDDPGFVAIHPHNNCLYALQSGTDGKVKAFSINSKNQQLTLLNTQPSSGMGPCHISLDNEGKYLLVANYASGSVAVFPIKNDGSLAPATAQIQHHGASITSRQQGPHSHSINLSPDNAYAYVADLGLDKIMIYKFNEQTGQLITNDPPFVQLKLGAGPRHLTFDAQGHFVYVINELDATITVFSYQAVNGALIELQTISTLPTDFNGINLCAEIKVHPNNKFLYGSNRGHDSIVIYRINQQNGQLTLVGFQTQGIDEPRHFNIDPSGQYCLIGNQDINNVALFSIDQTSGLLTPTPATLDIGKPICIKFKRRNPITISSPQLDSTDRDINHIN
jgi:6-phosphogluconolactonase